MAPTSVQTAAPAVWQESGRLGARRRAPARDLARVPPLASGDGYLFQVDIVFGPRPRPGAGRVGGARRAAAGQPPSSCSGRGHRKLYAVGALFLAGFAPMVLLRRAPWYARVPARSSARSTRGSMTGWSRASGASWSRPPGSSCGWPRGRRYRRAGARLALCPGAGRRRCRRVRSPHARPGRSARDRRWPVASHLAGPRHGSSGRAPHSRCSACSCRTGSSRSSQRRAPAATGRPPVHARRLRVLPFRLQRRLRAARQPGRPVRLLGRAGRPLSARERGRPMVAAHQRGDRGRRARWARGSSADRAWLLSAVSSALAVSASTALPGRLDAAVWLSSRDPARGRLPRAAEVERALAPGGRHPLRRSGRVDRRARAVRSRAAPRRRPSPTC